jgi:hypothetical protein
MSALDDALVARLLRLRREDLLAMYEAAAEAVGAAAALAASGKNPVTEVIGQAETVDEWAHFPPGEAIDPDTHSQYYYHAHAAAERADGEHGHFHTFVRPDKLFPELKPTPRAGNGEMQPDSVTHLVGLSTDASGNLVGLFTTNRWVTDEIWYDADTVLRMLERFDMVADKPSRTLNRWVSAMLRAFRPQIEHLIRDRDLTIARWQDAHPGQDVLEDRALQVISEVPVDFLAQVRAIEKALAQSAVE